METIDAVSQAIFTLFDKQKFIEQELDYSKLERHKIHLQLVADLGNSVVSVMDAYKKQHVFHSTNFGSVLGYNLDDVERLGERFMASIIHPDDLPFITKVGLSGFKLFFNLSDEEKLSFKLINEFRVLNASKSYVRVIEQHQVLELDKRGNIWLSLSILDISPNQDVKEGPKSQLLNFRNGRFIPIDIDQSKPSVVLTLREIEILKLVKEGLLSKEISDVLSISVHTVNTHRQRVLEKLGANNSIEAVALSSKLGLL